MPDDSYLDSAILSDLRGFLKAHPTLQQLTGPIAQYGLVIDANMVVADLLHKHHNPHIRRTAIEEAARSSAIQLYAPTWLEKEIVGSAIPQVSKQKGISEADLHELWMEYKQQIIWDDTYSTPGDDHKIDGQDLKDLPYVALQQAIAAAAILSRDKDIDALGGKRVDLEFVLSVRSYARAASYFVGIRVGGVFVGRISVGLLIELARSVSSVISRLPSEIKVVLLVAAAFVVIHPRYRVHILALLSNLGEHLVALWPHLEALVVLAAEKQREADAALVDANRTCPLM